MSKEDRTNLLQKNTGFTSVKTQFTNVNVQGHPMQTVFFETALTDRNMQVRFDLMIVLEC